MFYCFGLPGTIQLCVRTRFLNTSKLNMTNLRQGFDVKLYYVHCTEQLLHCLHAFVCDILQSTYNLTNATAYQMEGLGNLTGVAGVDLASYCS